MFVQPMAEGLPLSDLKLITQNVMSLQVVPTLPDLSVVNGAAPRLPGARDDEIEILQPPAPLEPINPQSPEIPPPAGQADFVTLNANSNLSAQMIQRFSSGPSPMQKRAIMVQIW